MRKLVSIKRITNISPIPNADRIEAAEVGGWVVVVSKGEFLVGDAVLYFEIDAVLPEGVPEFASVQAHGQREVPHPTANKLVTGHVLRTAKLRGVISQGLVLPLAFGLTEDSTQADVDAAMEQVGVFKYEPPLPTGGLQVGVFPREARKTDSERVQNLSDEFLAGLDASEWVATEKIDGTSSTFLKRDGKIVVASRNWEVDPDNSLQGRMAKQLDLVNILPEGAILQGEIFGEGIAGNPLRIQGTRLLVFSSSTPVESPEFTKFVASHQVPQLTEFTLPSRVSDAVAQVDKLRSKLNPKALAEGVVWWNTTGRTYAELGDRANFKAINNAFLLKHGG